MPEMHRAVFLDRDGTLIEDVGILKNPEDINLYPDTIEALQILQERYLLFVVTNQTWVSRGELSMAEVETVNAALDGIFSEHGIRIEKWYVCPHGKDDECECRKPGDVFLREAAGQYGLDLGHSFIIGDHPHDVVTGKSLGVFGLYVLTGHGRRHLCELNGESLIFHGLREAAGWIMDHPNSSADLEDAVARGAESLRRGGLVVFPTETVYGLGADALNPDAVRKIFTAKQRPLYNPLIVHVADRQQVELLVEDMPAIAVKLMDRFWPGPLTLVLPKSRRVPDIITAGNPTVAVRMPSHRLALELIAAAGTPVAAPSANSFGRTSPTTADHVREQLDGRYDVLIDGGACQVGVESTVLSLIDPIPKILRHGGVTREAIESVVGPVTTLEEEKPEEEQGKRTLHSPGMLPSHYAPRTPVRLYTVFPHELLTDAEVGFLLLQPSEKDISGPVEVLSATGDLSEAATNLYAALLRLDSAGLRLIVSHPFPSNNIGAAINDRLTRASRDGERNEK
jgi:L-threonylcarbamoyladenylate synthase